MTLVSLVGIGPVFDTRSGDDLHSTEPLYKDLDPHVVLLVISLEKEGKGVMIY